MDRFQWKNDQPGMALVTVILVLLVVGAISTAAALISSNAFIIDYHDQRQSFLETVAESGLEEARARINGDEELADKVFEPIEDREDPFVVIEDRVTVTHADGSVIPGVRRSTFAGPIGATTGQYGIFGTIVTVVEDANGDRLVRRRDLIQRSFAEFAYFTDNEGIIVFGGGDRIEGKVHSNDNMTIHASGATFTGQVTTARRVINPGNGRFEQGYTERVDSIKLPNISALERVKEYAEPANMAFTAPGSGNYGEPLMRIEFDTVGDIGFIRIYEGHNASRAYWVSGAIPPSYSTGGRYLADSPNCAHWHADEGRWVAAIDHPSNRSNANSWPRHVIQGNVRCFLGGANELNGGVFRAEDVGVGGSSAPMGRWRPLPAGVDPHPAVEAAFQAAGRDDVRYAYPIDRRYNPDFKGVIYVDGNVGISGVVKGHITLAAKGDIVILDNLVYATRPGSSNRLCTIDDNAEFDILGLFAGNSILVADNTLNSPTLDQYWNGTNWNGSDRWATRYISFRSPQDLNIHATILTLNTFAAVRHDQGNKGSSAPCINNPNSFAFGRGCLRITGGIIQGNRGAVGLADGSGYLKDYAYDPCVMTNPPPYFPTTGVSARGSYYEVDPTGFDINDYFDRLVSRQ